MRTFYMIGRRYLNSRLNKGITASQRHGRRFYFNFSFLTDCFKMSSKGDLENETWLNIGNFRVFAWSLAGIETSIVIRCSDGYSCCFDLGHASRESVKCDTVFISHGHMDHVVALPHHVKKRELTSCKPAKYYVPDILVRPLKDICGNFADLNGGNTPLSSPNIVPVIPGQKIELSKGYHAVAFPTVHRVQSQGYLLYKTKKVLKEEFQGLAGPEIGAKIRSGVDVHKFVETPEVAYTGDTTFQVFTDEVYKPSPDLFRVKLLIVETTYIDDEKEGKNYVEIARQWGHVHLLEIYKNAKLFKNVDHILLMHFSDRYSVDYIRKKVYDDIPEELRNKIHIATLAKQQYI